MTTRSTFTKSALAAVAGVMAMSAMATGAQAQQPYYGGAQGGGYYDPCQRDSGNRGITGALIGGAGGAVIGSQFAASGHRRDGSLLGGVLGALAGAAVGKNTAGCSGGQQTYAPPPAPRSSSYYAPQPQPYAYDDRAQRYDDRYVEQDDSYAYGRGGERFRVAQRPGADGCTLAESPILMPDGRTQTHFVRVCMDRNGRYQVVN
jgi:uncharacterized protein YcfJ